MPDDDETITLSTEPEPEPEPEADTAAEPDEPDTFPRDYVERLRQEAAEHRVRAKDRDDLARRLHTALVAATGRLADPTDLAFSEEHLAGNGALQGAIDELLTRKPHLASRRPVGDIGQGAATAADGVSLAGILRASAS